MGGQSVFNGALGWDDWIWWSAIGGLGLFLLMLVLCCVVCVQRAKRKGREEAMAAVQARERERQTQEQAQLRYAQAQQARYPPAREASYKFSKPEPPASTYNPYGQEDHAMHRNSFHNNAPVPRPKSRRGSQQPSGQQPMQQDAQYKAYQGPPPPKHNGQQQQFYGAAPRRDQPPTMPYEQSPQPYDQPRLRPEELPQVAAYYGRKPKPSAELSPNSGRIMSQQYQRQTQVNPNQPAIAQYLKFSSRSDTPSGPAYVQDDSLTKDETPFVQVSSPRASGASTASASTAYSAVGQPPQVVSDRISLASSSSSAMMRPGATLRSRIDALRVGPAPAPSNENFTRISMGSTTSSLSGSQSSFQAPVQPIPPPTAPSDPVVNRRLDAIASTDLSDASSPGNEYSVARNDNAFDEAVFATARSTQGTVRRRDSDLSIGVDEDPSSPAIQRDQTRRNTRGRTHTGDSTGSIEF